MKLTFVDDFQLAAILNDGVVDLSVAVTDLKILPPQQLINQVIAQWQSYKVTFEKLILSATPKPLSAVRLRAPLPKPVSIVCMAVNYMENGLLKKKPAAQAFFKNSHSVIGHNDTMHLPDTQYI